ncbi:hypothetical protein BCR44DRAFT_43639 [Catenaria anguillulae PL171]|uniref:F-box domain-containing protein n=1 Tax=Catenaria anguillulae PL171 TaxID=765915 RepID=A0A1Y2HZF8_9FUNG|nr:hypothetical protein BCR44DRAFT_43639 [Catenaria anguillulae PL171]
MQSWLGPMTRHPNPTTMYPSMYEFDEGEINLRVTKSSGPHFTRHLSSLLHLTTQLESLTLKQLKSIDVPHLLTILASSCSSLHTLSISELDNACRPIGVQRWGYDYLPITTSITQSLSTLASLHTLKLDDVESTTMSALLVQHLACPLLTSLSLCNKLSAQHNRPPGRICWLAFTAHAVGQIDGAGYNQLR